MDKSKSYQLTSHGKLEMADIPPKETWKQLETFVESGKIKSLGVSNFSENQIDEILSICKYRPQVNQGMSCQGQIEVKWRSTEYNFSRMSSTLQSSSIIRIFEKESDAADGLLTTG